MMTRISSVKKLPWLSLFLLLFAYFNVGWVLYASTAVWWVWLLVTVCSLGIIEALAFPLSLLRILFSKWIRSDTRAFFAAILLAFLTVLFLSWIDIAAHTLLIVAAATLARLDLQTVAISELKAFFILSIFSFLGLALGGVVHGGVNHFELIVKFLTQLF